MFGGWNPIKDIGDAVSKTAKEIGNGLESTRKVVESGDIGKVIKAASAPVVAPINAAQNVVRGDFKAATGNIVGGHLNRNAISQGINSSSSVRDFADNETVNNLTLGWSRDAARAADSQNNLMSGSYDDSDISNISRYGARSVIYGGAGMLALSNGAASKAGTYAAEHPTEALVMGKLASEGRYTDIGQGVLNDIIPGAGDLVDSILNPGIPKPELPGTISTPGQKAPIDPLLKAAAFAVGSLILILVIKKMRAKRK